MFYQFILLVTSIRAKPTFNPSIIPIDILNKDKNIVSRDTVFIMKYDDFIISYLYHFRFILNTVSSNNNNCTCGYT